MLRTIRIVKQNVKSYYSTDLDDRLVLGGNSTQFQTIILGGQKTLFSRMLLACLLGKRALKILPDVAESYWPALALDQSRLEHVLGFLHV